MRFADVQVWPKGCYVYENRGETRLPKLWQ
jgi:hypothetical protein